MREYKIVFTGTGKWQTDFDTSLGTDMLKKWILPKMLLPNMRNRTIVLLLAGEKASVRRYRKIRLNEKTSSTCIPEAWWENLDGDTG